MDFLCPLPTALTAIPQSNCPFRFDQIVRLAVRRRTNAAFASSTTFNTLATWTPLLAASDDTKIVMTPIFTNPVIPSSTGTFVGGNDNTTFNGIREYYGEQNVEFTAEFKNPAPAQLAALDKLSQESLANSAGVSNLEIFMFNRYGYGFSSALDGIQVYNFRVGTMGSAGLNAANIVPFSFDLLFNWDRALVSSKPTFDPLVDLQNS